MGCSGDTTSPTLIKGWTGGMADTTSGYLWFHQTWLAGKFHFLEGVLKKRITVIFYG